VGKKTVMHKTARLTGNIVTPVLAMEEGAALQGKVQMTQEPMPDDMQLSLEANLFSSSNVN
jgi:cytoskeletal protein CcmA (bactofilin family)